MQKKGRKEKEKRKKKKMRNIALAVGQYAHCCR
jgi:hypothetical protein